MSFAIKQALQSSASAEALKSLAEKGGMYHKGQDIAHALSTKIQKGEPYYPPIFSVSQDEGQKQGFLDYFGVKAFEELPQSDDLVRYIGSVMLVDVEKTSQLRPHENDEITPELTIVGAYLPAVRVLLIEHGQTVTS